MMSFAFGSGEVLLEMARAVTQNFTAKQLFDGTENLLSNQAKGLLETIVQDVSKQMIVY